MKPYYTSEKEFAILARVRRAYWPGGQIKTSEDKAYVLEPIVPRNGLSACRIHLRPVYFDSGECPCCELMREHRDGKLQTVSKEQAAKEFLALTTKMK